MERRRDKALAEKETDRQGSEVRLCTFCQGNHTHMSAPSSWKDERAKSLSRQLNVMPNEVVCRACRDDISRVVKDPEHTPRWKKREEENCSMSGCREMVFTKTNVATEEQLNSIANRLGYSTGKFHLPTPLCKMHYHLIYREVQPSQTTCVTCGVYIGKASARVCPNPHYVRWL